MLSAQSSESFSSRRGAFRSDQRARFCLVQSCRARRAFPERAVSDPKRDSRSTDNNDTKRENGDVLLVFEIAIHRHESIDQAACALQQSAVLGARPAQSLHGGYGMANQGAGQVVREILVKQYAHVSSGSRARARARRWLVRVERTETAGETRRESRRPRCSRTATEPARGCRRTRAFRSESQGRCVQTGVSLDMAICKSFVEYSAPGSGLSPHSMRRACPASVARPGPARLPVTYATLEPRHLRPPRSRRISSKRQPSWPRWHSRRPSTKRWCLARAGALTDRLRDGRLACRDRRTTKGEQGLKTLRGRRLALLLRTGRGR